MVAPDERFTRLRIHITHAVYSELSVLTELLRRLRYVTNGGVLEEHV
jgi:hypothetical protein